MPVATWDAALWDSGYLWDLEPTPLGPAGNPLSWLSGRIGIRVEIDTALEAGAVWDASEWDASLWGSSSPEWRDMTEYVLGVNTTQGAERWGQRFSAGSGSLRLDNRSGQFTPEGGTSDFNLPFRTGRKIRIVAIPDLSDPTTKVPLFTGYVEDALDSMTDGFDLETTVAIVDQMTELSEHDPPAQSVPTGIQLSSDRVEDVLDLHGWPVSDRDIQTGDHSLQSSLLAESILEEIQTAADAEGGAFYFSPAGVPTFRSRDWLTTDARSVAVQGWLGYEEAPGNAGLLLSVSPSRERARVVNQVKYARVGSTFQTVEDADSIVALGATKTAERTDLECSTDAEVLFLAERTLAAFKDERLRIDAVTFSALDDPDDLDLNRLMWDSRIGDRIALRVGTGHGWEYELETHVMGIAHSITADDWLVTFRLDDAQTFEA